MPLSAPYPRRQWRVRLITLKPGTWIPNLAQQQYFIEATVKAVLPRFKDIIKDNGNPFVLVFWSRDPDGTQHNHGDSFHSTSPGINGPTSLAAIRNADTALGAIEQALKALDLYDTTNIVVAADHGFSTISKTSGTSPSRRPKTPYSNNDVQPGELPPGFLAIDLVTALQAAMPSLKLFDPDDHNRELNWRNGKHPSKGNGILAEDPTKPQVVVAANGGSDLIYIPWRSPMRRAANSPAESSARFSNRTTSAACSSKGPLRRIPRHAVHREHRHWRRQAAPPHPAIVVNFASRKVEGCKRVLTLCAAEIADTAYRKVRACTAHSAAPIPGISWPPAGPDFRRNFSDPLPASNADIGMTLAKLLELMAPPKGPLAGRVLSEALAATATADPLPTVTTRTETSRPGANGLQTLLKMQVLGTQTYLDVAGFRDRTVGLETP